MSGGSRVRRLGVSAALVDGVLVPGDVAIVADRVGGVGLHGEAGDLLAVPGFVDLQVNGFAGTDFLRADIVPAHARQFAARGDHGGAGDAQARPR